MGWARKGVIDECFGFGFVFFSFLFCFVWLFLHDLAWHAIYGLVF